jgi:hypothetical protein
MDPSDNPTADAPAPRSWNWRPPSRLATLAGAMLIVGTAVLVEACGGSTEPGPALTVTKAGPGSGGVTSSPTGIDCGAACQNEYSSGTAVTLTATPDPGSFFVGWAGAGCSGADTCEVAVTAATTVMATFDKFPNGAFTVKQIETLGGETISGTVCDLTKPFAVPAVAPRASWTFLFVPNSATQGTVTYSYSIPSAGETHNASGTYKIGPPAGDGTLQLSLTVSDHVTFKGFDGNIPEQYKFGLVPTAACP